MHICMRSDILISCWIPEHGFHPLQHDVLSSLLSSMKPLLFSMFFPDERTQTKLTPNNHSCLIDRLGKGETFQTFQIPRPKLIFLQSWKLEMLVAQG